MKTTGSTELDHLKASVIDHARMLEKAKAEEEYRERIKRRTALKTRMGLLLPQDLELFVDEGCLDEVTHQSHFIYLTFHVPEHAPIRISLAYDQGQWHINKGYQIGYPGEHQVQATSIGEALVTAETMFTTTTGK